MSTRFDDEVRASWGHFEVEVTRALTEIADDCFSIDLEGETAETGAFPYIQFVGDGEMLRAEVSGNAVLDPAHQMQVHQEHALVALGWQRPAGGESPNWWFDLERDQVDLLMAMVTATFRQVFGVVHPRFLVSERLLLGWVGEGGGPADWSVPPPEGAASVDVPVMGFPEDHDQLVALVRQTLTGLYGDSLIQDEDGDFAITTGTVPLWVRPHPDRPLVRIFSYLVTSVRDIRQARIEVAILNRRQDLRKFVLADGLITATYDLPAAPFVGPQLLWTIVQVAEQLDALAEDSAVRVGGKLWLDEVSHAASDRGELA